MQATTGKGWRRLYVELRRRVRGWGCYCKRHMVFAIPTTRRKTLQNLTDCQLTDPDYKTSGLPLSPITSQVALAHYTLRDISLCCWERPSSFLPLSPSLADPSAMIRSWHDLLFVNIQALPWITPLQKRPPSHHQSMPTLPSPNVTLGHIIPFIFFIKLTTISYYFVYNAAVSLI